MNKTLEKDINTLVKNEKYFSDFMNRSILITGATGLIGSITAKALLRFSQLNKANITLYVNCRSMEKFNKVFETYKADNLIPIISDIKDIDISNISVDYVIHGASITDSKTFITKPVETIDIAINGTKRLLDQCKDKQLKGFVYLSSLEIYGSFPNTTTVMNVSETESGYIDTTSVRSSYSEGKRIVETLCIAYQQEYNIPVKICRLCQTFGAGVTYTDNRVFAQFARAIIENTDIVLKTKGETVRNYCYTTDAVSGILTVLSKGIIGNAYNVANMNTTISIAKMAELVCSLFPDNKSKVVYDLVEDSSKLGYNPIVRLQLDSRKLMALGWQPDVNLDDMYRNLINGMRDDRIL